jgi:hypothetical protein
MRWTHRIGGLVLTLAAGAALVVAGCGKTESQTEQASGKGGPAAGKESPGQTQVAQAGAKKGEAGHGWWCAEHGVPEALCSLCSDALAARLKKEGDWCKEHDRAASQCFRCDPKRYEKFAAMYEARYGKTPPRPPESEFQK